MRISTFDAGSRSLPGTSNTSFAAHAVTTDLKTRLQDHAKALGFDAVRITGPKAASEAATHLFAFLELGRHGDMDWMATHAVRRADPAQLMANVESIVMLGLSYAPDHDPLQDLEQRDRGIVSVYAKGRDYHDIIKSRLKQLARFIQAESGADVKVFVDTAPLMEKPLAAAAGIGWQGKHTNLVSRTHGSWLFLGAILTSAALARDDAEADNCGSCRRCIDICPTNAIPEPYQLDARRCIAYLTIEHKGHIPKEFRHAIGNRVFGCDDCLAVCPWNKFAERSKEARFAARAQTDNPSLAELLRLDDDAFRARFAGTPVKRTGRERFMRNVLIAAGNSGDVNLLEAIGLHLTDASPLVRAMAVWAIGRLGDKRTVMACLSVHLPDERDPAVRQEWISLEAT